MTGPNFGEKPPREVFHLRINLDDLDRADAPHQASAQDVAKVLRNLARQLDDCGPVPGAGYLHSDGANVGNFTIQIERD